MIDWIAYGLLPRYPHMGSADAAVWELFIRENPQEFDKVAYDVAVGAGAEFDTTVNHESGGNVSRIYQRRIDVLGVKDGKYTVVEVKERATSEALGQVDIYAELAVRDFEEVRDPRLLIVARSLAPEMQMLADKRGVELRVV